MYHVCIYLFLCLLKTNIYIHTQNMTVAKHSDKSPLLPGQHPHTQPPPPPPAAQYVIVLPAYPPPHHHFLFRKSCQRCLFCLATLFIFLIAAGYLLWPAKPQLSIIRLRLDRLQFHTIPKMSVDVTMDLTVKVRNEDFYAMYYDSLVVAIGYRGKRLGYVTSDGGRIGARGSSYVNATLQLDRVEVMSDVVSLIEDLAKGAVTFDAESEISGKLEVFYFFNLPLKTEIECEVVVSSRNQTISHQSCYPEVSEVS